MGRYSFPVRLFHPLLHAGFNRRFHLRHLPCVRGRDLMLMVLTHNIMILFCGRVFYKAPLTPFLLPFLFFSKAA